MLTLIAGWTFIVLGWIGLVWAALCLIAAIIFFITAPKKEKLFALVTPILFSLSGFTWMAIGFAIGASILS